MRPALALALVPVLLATSIMVGLRSPAVTYPSAALPSGLDYSRHAVPGVTGLRTGFIERVLGSAITPEPVSGLFRGNESIPRIKSELDRDPPLIEHPLVNDDFDNAYPVTSLPFWAKTDTSEATAEPNEPSDCARVGDKTVWYRLDLPIEAGLIADTFGTDHAVDLRVFSGKDLGDLSLVGCDSSTGGDAHVAFSGTRGTRYYFQVSAIAGGKLSFNVRVQGATMLMPNAEDFDGVVSLGSSDGRHWVFTGQIVRGDASIQSCITGPYARDSNHCSIQAYALDTHKSRDTDPSRIATISLNRQGLPANGISLVAGISAGGRYVSFTSSATDLVPNDTNTCGLYQAQGNCFDVFVRDRDADEDGRFDEKERGAVRNIRVSVSDEGDQGNGWSALGWISADGRFVSFQSEANNLVRGDTNGVGDAFIHDRDADEDGIFDEQHAGARRTSMLTVSTSERPAEGPTAGALTDAVTRQGDYLPFEYGNHLLGMSSTGRFAVFRSPAGNLVEGDTNGSYDVFLRDVFAGTTTRVNVSSDEEQANKGTRLHNAFARPVSDDGRYVLFNSDATNLVRGDTNGSEDLFLRDLVLGTTRRISIARDGRQAKEPATPGRDVFFGGLVTITAAVIFDAKIFTLSELNHAMTADGRKVFFSSAAQLVPEDDDEHRDIYVRDLRRGTLSLVSVSTAGEKGNASSNQPWPSMDGRVVAFGSSATNLDDAPRRDPDTTGLVWTPYLRFLPPEI